MFARLSVSALCVLVIGCGGSGTSSQPSTAASAAVAGAAGTSTTLTPPTRVWRHPNASRSRASAVLPPNSTGLSAPAMFGTIPPDPETGFSGQLFFVGEALVPGSQIRVTFQGVPTKFLVTTFHSSELLSAYVFLTVPGDYRFDAVDPFGGISGGFDLVVPQGSLPGLLAAKDPDLQMIFPGQVNQGFMGTVWLMGENFVQGSGLMIELAGAPAVYVPAVFINERTLAWETAAPLSGSLKLRVINPDMRTSAELTWTVSAVTLATGQSFAAPRMDHLPAQLTVPFVGHVRIHGSDFLPGALLEWTLPNGRVLTVPAIYRGSGELLWVLAYPMKGTHSVKVINPDGQRSGVDKIELR